MECRKIPFRYRSSAFAATSVPDIHVRAGALLCCACELLSRTPVPALLVSPMLYAVHTEYHTRSQRLVAAGGSATS
jgi:hypothetical protein